jgi:polyhydroxyalkanoate synthesis regulator phasin
MTQSDSKQKEEKKSLRITLTFKEMVEIFKLMITKRKGFLDAVEIVVNEKIDHQVKNGSLSKAEGEKTKKEARDAFHSGIKELSGKFDTGIQRTLNALHIATLKDFNALETQLDALNDRLDQLLKKDKPTRKTAPRKTTPKKTAPKSSKAGKAKPKAAAGRSPVRKTSGRKPAGTRAKRAPKS